MRDSVVPHSSMTSIKVNNEVDHSLFLHLACPEIAYLLSHISAGRVCSKCLGAALPVMNIDLYAIMRCCMNAGYWAWWMVQFCLWMQQKGQCHRQSEFSVKLLCIYVQTLSSDTLTCVSSALSFSGSYLDQHAITSSHHADCMRITCRAGHFECEARWLIVA